MRTEGAALTPEERILVAEYLTRRPYAAEPVPDAVRCAGPPWTGLDADAVAWTGFAGNLAGTGYQPPERAGLLASDVPDLELRWAFAFPGGTSMADLPRRGRGRRNRRRTLRRDPGPRPRHRMRALELRGGRPGSRRRPGGRGSGGRPGRLVRRRPHDRLRRRARGRIRPLEAARRPARGGLRHREPGALRGPPLRPRLLPRGRPGRRPPLRVLHLLGGGRRARRSHRRGPLVPPHRRGRGGGDGDQRDRDGELGAVRRGGLVESPPWIPPAGSSTPGRART